MGTAKHTPGPWGMETVRTSCGVCHKIGPWPHKWRAGEMMSACIYDDYPSPPEGTDTMLANARLIVAAPDLLDALREAHALLLAPAEDLKDGVLSRIRAAISKATGPRTAADAINDIRADLATLSKAEAPHA